MIEPKPGNDILNTSDMSKIGMSMPDIFLILLQIILCQAFFLFEPFRLELKNIGKITTQPGCSRA